jgi:HlyD family secretion protein
LKKLLLVVLLAGLAGLGWWIYQRKTDAPDVPFAKVKRETLISTLPTNGKVEPLEWEAVRVDTPGLIDTVSVQEGQSVSKGAPIARLKAAGLESELTAAQARLAQARAELANIERGGKSTDLAEIESSLARARFDREAAQREYAALQRLAEKQAATPNDVQAARGKLRQAELDIEALERRRAALVSQPEKTVAEARLKEAGAAVELAQRRIEQTVIRSPLAGVVYNLSVRPGTYLAEGDLVANVGRLDKLRVRVYVDEPELGRVAVGEPVTITWDGLPGTTWNGAVEKMPTSVVPLGTRQVGEVLCTIDNPGRELVPGTNVNAEVRSNVVPSTLTIPKEAVRRETGSAGVAVWLLKGNTVIWQKVKLGAASVTRVQVTGGLAEGDSVALPTERPLRAGEPIEPVYP